ncbi:MAG: sulfotransferase [Okeania sp. SIO3B3]|nr:sulfotransferase [Okeania sp. SIO3B3]
MPFKPVLPPSTIDTLVTELTTALEAQAAPDATTMSQHLDTFKKQWHATFAQFEQTRTGELAYQDLLVRLEANVLMPNRRWLRNSAAVQTLQSMMGWIAPATSKRPNWKLLAKRKRQSRLNNTHGFDCPHFEKPVFIVSMPRAGSTLLFETLSHFPNVWTIGEESHEVIEGMTALHPAACDYSSNRLTAADATPTVASTLRERFTRKLQTTTGQPYLGLPAAQRPRTVRFLEKTPKNALRIPFLQAVFPEALFIYLYRDPAENISSLMEGWRSRRFIGYRNMPGWPYLEWSFLLVPGWHGLHERPLAEIAAYQWQTTNALILEDLQTLPASRWHFVHYTDLIQTPRETIHAISTFANLPWNDSIEQLTAQALPVSQLTFSKPAPDKWRINEVDIAPLLPTLDPLVELIAALRVRS